MTHHVRSKLNKGNKAKYTLIALLVSIIGVTIAFVSYVFPRPAARAPLYSGSLRLRLDGYGYYLPSGAIPNGKPPDYREENANYHCNVWQAWMYNIGAAQLGPDLALTTIANSSSPITILSVRFVVYNRRSLMGDKRVKCVYMGGGMPGTIIYPNLDFPARPIPMQIQGSESNTRTSLPPGEFVVEPNGASLLWIDLNGTEGYVYEYAMIVRVVENAVERSEQFGSRAKPLRIAFERKQISGLKYFDWDTVRQAWVHVSPQTPPQH